MTSYRVSMDIGGTFTDIVTFDETTGQFRAAKASTTPGHLSTGVLGGLESLIDDLADIDFIVHGTTQGLNAFLERRGVRVLLLATDGAQDVYHIARGPRHRLYDAQYRKPEPLIERRDVVGIPGRFQYDGSELAPLDEEAVRAAAHRAKDEGYGAVAVGYLFSYRNPTHELRTREILREVLGEDFTVSLSHEAAKEWREYERTSSAVIEAYTGPVVRSYLLDLEEQLGGRGVDAPLHIMQSSGGVLTAKSARERPLQTLLSGPVGGAIGGEALTKIVGNRNLIGVDMGGTSFDVSLVVDGTPDVSTEAALEGLPMLMSIVNIHTIGAGGGSVAWIEAGGLRVGPRSAGAQPGPACYGRGGTEPTVTDANFVLGRVDAENFAGGQMQLDREAAVRALETVGNRLGFDAIEIAEGICNVANSQMAQAIRTITISRGIEPRDFSLVAFGGAGPMHAVFLAKELGIRETIVPRFPGAFSAWGMLQGDIRRDFTEPYYFLDEDIDPTDMSRVLRGVEAEALTSLESEGIPSADRYAEHAVDVRYLGQEYFLTVPLRDADEPLDADFLDALGRRFATAYEARYGHSTLGAPIEIVTLRTRVVGRLENPSAFTVADAASAEFVHEIRQVVFDGEAVDTIVTERDDLGAGHEFTGPAIVIEATATTVVPPGFTVRVDAHGSLVITNLEIESEA
ncbi:hydantoinase/oxoprolinase family protein [Agromyces aerolatus]|uniref:hydantoinase/oxoprolinase family protein n=1 Tax=Agromyces sp. LY-1074 TaxID=3074080 RepID=UPI00285B8538|nr:MULTISPECIES: hydantoinase/oxoprolinase family protein [unclassified Agromyces]MDR5701136.1 hydantoinase/oxoprolinase family protein [Agromyces sp. LY-1074]MDR5707776.1 hydantoinase/oxoprolinase family protein [Agromyces sp. LY-1358]